MRLKIKLLDKKYEEYYNVKKNYSSDSGFDLYCTEDVTVEPFQVGTVKSGICCQPFVKNNEKLSGYYLYPRSSICKTPLMLANSVGVIDLAYMGEILSKVRNMSNESYTVKAGTSLFQLCSPDLKPFEEIIFVDELEKTERGDGGFGSTNNNTKSILHTIPVTSLYVDN